MDLLFQNDAVPIQNTLASKIIKSFADCDFETHAKYLPESCRTRLLTSESIKEEVSRIIEVLKGEGNDVEKYDEKYQQELTEWIFTNASKVFAITAECDFVPRFHFAAIDCFYKSRFDDSRLPLDDPQSKAPPDSSFHPVIWNDVKLGHFYGFQWKYLAPIFSSGIYHYDLESHRIFPFETRVGNPKIGAFGQVYRVKIHEGHQKHPDLQDVAVKVINMNRAEDEKGANIAWEAEARALEDMNKIDHPHIIKCIAAISRGKNRYFIFPWADGDSLRDFWDATPEQTPTEQLILHVIQQLRALADALEKLHNFQGESFSTMSVGSSKSEAKISGLEVPQTRVVNERNEVHPHTQEAHEESYRHGDLKPENILRFLDQSPGLGTLKIADMGLAKRHVVRTQLRPNLTVTRYGTIRYEAPEARTSSHGLSRLYDVWSMGCITLEFIIWILHGNDALKSFHNQMKGVTEQLSQYYELTTGGPRDAEVHTVVRTWMDHIQETEPECQQISAIQELLNIVRTKLLVVPLPPDRPSTMEIRRPLAPPGIGENTTQYRATAAEFRDALDAMLTKVGQPHYLLTGRDRTNVSLPVPNIPAPKPDSLSPDAARRTVGPAAPNAQDGLAPRNQLLTGILPQRERTVGNL